MSGGGWDTGNIRHEIIIGTGETDEKVSDGPTCCRTGAGQGYLITGIVICIVRFGRFANPYAIAYYTFSGNDGGTTVTLTNKVIVKSDEMWPLAWFANGHAACAATWDAAWPIIDTEPEVSLFPTAPDGYFCGQESTTTSYTGFPPTDANKIAIPAISGPHFPFDECVRVCKAPLP